MLRTVLWCLIASVAGFALAASIGPATTSGAPAISGKILRWAYYVPDDPLSLASLRQRSGDLDYVGLQWAAMNADGTVTLKANPDVIQLVRSLGARPLLSVGLANGADTAHSILATDSSRTAAINALSAQLADYDGISIDFEGLYPQDRDLLTQFMVQLAGQLRPAGKLVTMALNAKTSDTRTGWTGALDYAALAPNADLFVIMAYGYRTSKSTVPGSSAPLPWVANSISFAASQIPPEKILLGIPLYGYDWDTTTGPPAKVLRFPDAMAISGQQGVPVDHDQTLQGAHFSYTKDGHVHQAWFEDQSTLDAKLALVAQEHLAGVAAWRLGYEDPRVWQSIDGLGQTGEAAQPSATPLPQPAAAPMPTPQSAPASPLPGQAAAVLMPTSQPTPVPTVRAAPRFVLGFKLIANQIPDIVGNPIENEWFDVRNGNSIQRTVNPKRLTPAGLPRDGMMVWRKSDNWTAFTDGYMTWVNGPHGLQSRLNSERFPWENDPIVPAASPTPAPAPQPAQVIP